MAGHLGANAATLVRLTLSTVGLVAQPPSPVVMNAFTSSTGRPLSSSVVFRQRKPGSARRSVEQMPVPTIGIGTAPRQQERSGMLKQSQTTKPPAPTATG